MHFLKAVKKFMRQNIKIISIFLFIINAANIWATKPTTLVDENLELSRRISVIHVEVVDAFDEREEPRRIRALETRLRQYSQEGIQIFFAKPINREESLSIRANSKDALLSLLFATFGTQEGRDTILQHFSNPSKSGAQSLSNFFAEGYANFVIEETYPTMPVLEQSVQSGMATFEFWHVFLNAFNEHFLQPLNTD